MTIPRRPKLTVASNGPSPQAALKEPPDGPRPPGTAWPAWLVMIQGPELGRKFELEPGETKVGRDLSSDIPIGGTAVANRHATFVNDGEEVTVVDQDTQTGTYVNDVRVDRQCLEHDDEVTLGRVRFKFLQDDNLESRYVEEIYRLATVDPLTQVYNKRYFLEALRRELERSSSKGLPMALLMLDIDRFKHCNDQLGLRVGDQVLRLVAELLRERVRKVDVLARYSGQQFVVILPETEADAAMRFAEDVRSQVEQTDFTFEDHTFALTVSVGVAARKADDDVDEVLSRADAGLYEAKVAGRNRVAQRN